MYVQINILQHINQSPGRACPVVCGGIQAVIWSTNGSNNGDAEGIHLEKNSMLGKYLFCTFFHDFLK